MERALHKQLRQDLEEQRANSEQLQAALTRALEQIATLDDSLNSANAKRHLAEQRLIKTRASLTYQLGYQLKTGTRSLGALLRLPAILFRLYRQARRNRPICTPTKVEHVRQSLPATAPVIAPPRAPPAGRGRACPPPSAARRPGECQAIKNGLRDGRIYLRCLPP